MLSVQWWSTPRIAWRPWNSSTAPALSCTGPGANGANGSLNRRTLQSVEHDTTASPSGVTASPLTGPAASTELHCCPTGTHQRSRAAHILLRLYAQKRDEVKICG